MDTIYALATARGKAGVAVIRVSGPEAFRACKILTGTIPPVRTTGLRSIRNSKSELLDEALIVPFAAGQSFTGEDVVELQLHGSVATVNAVLAALGDIEGLRVAEPGEFTRQALENERLDLTQVEGLADLVDAETESQRKQAMKVLSGALGEKVKIWRSKLIRAAALLEATIDFVDEDVPTNVRPEVLGLLSDVRNELQAEVRGAAVAERIRDGFEVAIVGPPNIGKSTLLNRLAGRDAAITSEIAGTTRDVIEVRMDLHGLPVTFLDTAGLRKAKDSVEQIGVKRAIVRAEAADLRVFLVDDDTTFSGLTPLEDDIVLLGKADERDHNIESISGKTGQGLSELIGRITKTLEDRTALAATATRQRHQIAMERAISAMDNAGSEIENGPDRTELAAEELRQALTALDSLVGLVDVEHILDEIFASFCVGK